MHILKVGIVRFEELRVPRALVAQKNVKFQQRTMSMTECGILLTERMMNERESESTGRAAARGWF